MPSKPVLSAKDRSYALWADAAVVVGQAVARASAFDQGQGFRARVVVGSGHACASLPSGDVLPIFGQTAVSHRAVLPCGPFFPMSEISAQ